MDTYRVRINSTENPSSDNGVRITAAPCEAEIVPHQKWTFNEEDGTLRSRASTTDQCATGGYSFVQATTFVTPEDRKVLVVMNENTEAADFEIQVGEMALETTIPKGAIHKVASWLATNYRQVLLSSFQTSEMVRKYEQGVAADGTPSTEVQQVTCGRKRKIRSSTARAMLAQAHYRFKMLLTYKMNRVGGRVIICDEEYTSKTCSRCGTIKPNLGGSSTFKCAICGAVLDRDLNAAKNIFRKNRHMLAEKVLSIGEAFIERSPASSAGVVGPRRDSS